MQMRNKIIFFCKGLANPVCAVLTSVFSDYNLKRRCDVAKCAGSPFNRAFYPLRFIISRQDNRNFYYFNTSGELIHVFKYGVY